MENDLLLQFMLHSVPCVDLFVTGSPAKRPSLFCRSSHSSPEHKHKAPTLSINKTKDSRGSLDRDDGDTTTSDNYLQISKTRELPHDQVSVKVTQNDVNPYSPSLQRLYIKNYIFVGW
jgi:hypothetical protein